MTTFLIILSVLTLIIVSFYGYLFHVIKNENPQFWRSKVKKIENRYSGTFPQHSVLFIGSSSIDYWKTLTEDMQPLKVLNHGIGGTKVADITYYADRLIFPFNPSAIVFFAGEYCSGHNNFYFINPNPDLMDSNGELRKDIFRFDKVHFNKEGYRIWTKAVKPILMKNFNNNGSTLKHG